MSFLKGVKNELTVRVTAEVAQDNGKVIKVPFKATYKRLPVDEIEKIGRAIEEDDLTMREVIRDCLVRWDDLEGDDGNPVEFDSGNLEFALNDSDYLAALAYGYIYVQSGKKAADKAMGKN